MPDVFKSRDGVIRQNVDLGNGAFAEVVSASVAAPVGGATEAKQDVGNASLATIATNTTGAATAANQATGNASLATIATNTTGAATAANQTTGNASLSSINSKTVTPISSIPSFDQSSVPVRSVGQNVTGAGFSAVGASVLDPFFVQTPIVGTGVSYNQATGAVNIVAGTTANAEFLARSVGAYRGSMRKRFTLTASQRIANNNLAVLLADLIGEGLAVTINSATSITVAIPGHTFDATNVGQSVLVGGIVGAAGVPGRYAIASVVAGVSINLTVAGWPASGSCTATLFGRNYVRHLVTGTVATNVAIDAQRNGWATGDTTATTITTASPGVLLQTELTGREIFFSNSLRASTTTPNFSTIGSRYENIPDQNVDLYVFLWSFNGTTAPASSTTWTLASLSVENFPNLPMYVQGFRSLGQQNALPVQLQSGTAANVLGTVSLAAAQTLATLTTLTGGTAAEDAATTANPHIIGGVVRTATAPTTLIAGDAARLTMSSAAQVINKPFSVSETDWQYTGVLTTTTPQAMRAAGAAGIRNYITGIQFQNTNATATTVLIQDGATTIAQFNAVANMATVADMEFPTPLKGTAATAMNVTCGTAGASVFMNAQGYQSA